MKFGKQIQGDQVPGWSQYYLDYKALKKIISALANNRPASEPQSPAHPWAPSSPGAILDSDRPSVLAVLASQDDDRGPTYQAHKAAFFFKLERELEKINAFYLKKEAELKIRLETLLAKRRAAAMRILPTDEDDPTQNHVEWSVVEEGFRLLERDLRKLQQFVEINATGFRKILKKWDKRSKSATKELYLARQVDVQPVFNRQLISDLSDTVATCLVDVTDLSTGLNVEKPAVNDLILSNQIIADRTTSHTGTFQDLESSLRNAVNTRDESSIREFVRYADTLASQPGGAINVTRILWKAIIDAPQSLADLILSCPAQPFDFHFVDDINGRTTLHSATMVGMLRLVNMCLEKGVEPARADAYGRSALHYACMNDHTDVCKRLLEVGLPSDQLDMDNYSPLTYATLKGSAGCVRALLEARSDPQSQAHVLSGDSSPLALASQAGHVAVVNLLLEYGARSVPNTNGEYPIHLAAKEGHAEICRILGGQPGWDVADKYNEWTPLFHAARSGHAGCVRALLDAGARVDAADEMGNAAVYYAAWFGHRECAQTLLQAMAKLPRHAVGPPTHHQSPPSDRPKPFEMDMDVIPSLSLPPPIMPYRIYGHNYLDKTYLVQLSLGQSLPDPGSGGEAVSPVRLHPRLTGSQSRDRAMHASPFLRLVVTARGDATAAPYSVSLPLKDESYVFSFQAASLDSLSLELTIYPNFGTKIIGRATALPALLRGASPDRACSLPILDHRLHVMGAATFAVNVISPFGNVALGVAGAVETYWKSLALPVRSPLPGPVIASAGTSPSNRSAVVAQGGQAVTVSSVAGSYLYLAVQVTQDLQPVVYSEWRLPEEHYTLGVADVSLAQFEELARRSGCYLLADNPPSALRDWRERLELKMISLQRLLQIVPASIGVALELAIPSRAEMARRNLRNRIELNDFVDCVLRVVLEASTSPEGNGPVARRRIIFSSFSPDLCAAMNWKQPNYPVFFASQCGRVSSRPPSCAAAGEPDRTDRRMHGLGAAVDVAKTNNLLGILLDAETLIEVPALIAGVKETGLLVCTFGADEHVARVAPTSGDGQTIDGAVQRGILNIEHTVRSLI